MKPAIVKMLLTVLVCWVMLTGIASAFDMPKYDPWYYLSQEKGYRFQVPDKAQHFYGSAFLSELGKQLDLPAKKITAPALAFTAGFFYEVWQQNSGIGFSERDLVADALGVAASALSSDSFKMWLDYSTTDRTIMFRVRKFWG